MTESRGTAPVYGGGGIPRFIYECVRCGKPTARRKKMAGRHKRIYCSAECRALGRTYPDRDCAQCGATFNPQYAGRAGRIDRKFCSHECYLAHKRNQVTKTCPVCGKEYTVPASAAGDHRVCSTACKTVNAIYRDCERCGKRFRSDRRESHNSRYCSEECRRPPFIVACQSCGKEFRRPGNKAGTRFCSPACSRIFRGETGLEARVRVALELLRIDFQQEYPAGRYSIDFALVQHQIALEADGDYWHRRKAAHDAKRDARLARAGWRVIRLAETEVNSAPDTGQFILDRIREATGLELADLPQASSAAVARPAWRRKRGTPLSPSRRRRPTAGQMPLWS